MSSLIDRAQRQSTRGRRAVDPDQTRTLLTVAFRPAGVTIALVSLLVVITLIAANSGLTGTFGAIASIWLAVHQVPVTIDDTTLGVLPVVPTVIMIWVAAKGCAGALKAEHAMGSDSERAWTLRVVGAALAGPFLITLTSLAVVADASVVIPLSTPNVFAAIAWTLGVHGVAAAIGLGFAQWSKFREIAPKWVLGAMRPAVRALVTLLGAGALAVFVSMMFAWSTTAELLENGDGFVGMMGLTLLSVLYLPNVVVGAVAVLTGATARIGDVSVSVFGDVGGSLPPLPILAAVPDGPAGGVWPILLVVPFLVGILLGRDCGRKASGQQALLTVLAAASAAGLVAALVGVVAAGELGTFGAVDLEWWLFGLLTFVWLLLPGSVAAVAIAWVRSRRHAAAESVGTESVATESTDEELPAIASTPAPTTPDRVIEAEIVGDHDSDAGVAAIAGGDDSPTPAPDDVVDAEVEDVPTADTAAVQTEASDGDAGAESDLPKGPRTPSD